MPSWTMYLDRGLAFLARHDPQEAARLLEKALQECPPSRGSDLYRICFFLGIALRRMGHAETAIKSWVSCQRLRKRGPTRRLLSRLTNAYGMEKQARGELDDWKAFASIQLSRYLMGKNKRTFSTDAEKDMVVDLIRDHWVTLVKSGAIAGLDCPRKHALFTRTEIVFPAIVAPNGHQAVIAVNFQTRKKVGLADRCFCGSGMPFSLCCGRTPGCAEVLSGIF
jgi:hypothetical protein